MDRQTLYLDIDEEITSVVDKLKSAETAGIDLVIPKEALVLKSVVNLKLLKRQAETLGKEITVVTTDKVGKKLAEQIGIPVIEKPGDMREEVRMSATEPKIPAGAVEMGNGGALASEEPPIEFKPNAEDVVAPTAEVVGPAGTKVLNNKITEEPKTQDEKGKPGSSGAENKKKKLLKRWALIGGFVALLVAVAAYILVPLANVNIKLAAEKKKVDFNFTVDKANTAVDTTGQVIPGRLLSEDKEVSTKFPTTGKKKVGTKATGSVTLSNEFQTDPYTIVSGSRISTASGLIFKTTTNVTIPGFTMPGGTMKAGTVAANVEASDVGDNYNVAASHFTLPAFAGQPQATKIYADSSAAFTGGTSRDVQFVTQDDVNKAKEEMTKNANGDFTRAIQDKVESTERLLDNSMKITVTEATPSVAVNGEAAEFELKLKANIKAVVFAEEDLKKLATSVLGDQVGATKEIVESESLISLTTFTDADYEKGTMHASLSGEAFVATKIDQGKIKTDISGDAQGAATAYLDNIEGVDEIEIKFFPSFYKRMPRITSHIYIKTSLNKVQE